MCVVALALQAAEQFLTDWPIEEREILTAAKRPVIMFGRESLARIGALCII
jgi:hypothetical protein